jgi:CRISPR-associated protein Cas2
MGRCLVVYDIVDDRIRTRVSDSCLDYGLSRIQLSAFLGDIARTYQDELLQRIGRLLAGSPGHVVLFPLCESDFRGRREVATVTQIQVA